MKPVVHAAAGTMAMIVIACFWISTLISECLLSPSAVTTVKHAIVYGLFLLIPCMGLTVASGFVLSRTRQGSLLTTKKKRMRIIAANGALLMIPMAIFLDEKAHANQFDTVFYAVQVVELCVGAVQLALMGMNMRDGRALARCAGTGAHHPACR
jgi:hypothetical protein